MSMYRIPRQPSNEREQQNALLRANGYRWRREQNYYEADNELPGHWTLYAPDGQETTVSAALASIAHKEAEHAQAVAGICKPCQRGDHCFCTSPTCQCGDEYHHATQQ